MPIIDLQQIAASAYQQVLNMNQNAVNMIGLDSYYCRLLPYENSEDVIVQEYTLHQYECPKQLKVVSSKTDYQAGNFSIDLWGIHQEVPLEINIDITIWKSIYGDGTMPQKGDFILIPYLHEAFEVKSSSVVHAIAELPVYYKCVLGKWQHNANRKETEDFQVSIDELTISQDRLFGDEISKEVADAVIDVETSFNETTYVDPLKDFDIDSITVETIIGKSGNTIADAYYDFSNSTKNITYSFNSLYDRNSKENHWIYSCWFKGSSDNNILAGNLKINDIYLKEKDYWYLNIISNIEIAPGDEVTIYRGTVIKLKGTIENKECEAGYVIRIPAAECLKANKKVMNWWKSGVWKIQKASSYNLITLLNNTDELLKIDIDNAILDIKINNMHKTISLENFDIDSWHYFAFDLSPKNIRTILVKNKLNESTKRYTTKIISDKTTQFNISNFAIDGAALYNKGNKLCMTNIRLYENEYPLGTEYKLDMFNEVTRNASKLMLVDVPRPANKMSFKTPVR